MTKPRPSMFVGSSAEGLPVAEAIQLNLDYACEVTVWHQGVFGLSTGTLESLVRRTADFDFAALVLTPDDVTTSRSVNGQSPRDNVIFELGLFIGAIGRDRTFIVHEREVAIKLPSDLAGITPTTYQVHSTGDLHASMGAATTQIKSAVERLGKRAVKINAEISENTQFQIIHDLLDRAPEQFMILMHERNLRIKRQPRYLGSGINYEYAMRDSGGQGGFSIDELCTKLPDAELLSIDLRSDVFLTPRGHSFAQWLIDNGHKADFFNSDLGRWGAEPTDPSWTPFVRKRNR